MKFKELRYYYDKFKYGEDNFHNLMQYRVKEILLISTFYDAYIFEHDSLLSEQVVGEYHQLNLTTVPRITSVPTGEDALEILKNKHFDLVITTMRTGEDNTFELSRKIKQLHKNLPIILMLTVKSDIAIINRNRDRLESIENIFLWNGDSKLILAMIKYIEDKKNAPYDTENGHVKVILLVEDSINFISIYLPLLYTEIMEQTQRLISEELNDNQKYNRMRTRPKVLVTSSYEEGMRLYKKYKEHILCVMSDMEFYRNDDLDGDAGVKFLNYIKNDDPDLPCILQSSLLSNRRKAETLGVTFFHKLSQFLLKDLRHFIVENLGFGDLVFRDELGGELARAVTLSDFERILPELSMEVIMHHTRKKDFSLWLTAHGEMQLAKTLRPIEMEDFTNYEEYKDFLIHQFSNLRKMRNRGKIVTLNRESLRQDGVVTRAASGSLGGKGRGLAFFNSFLVTTEFEDAFKDAVVKIPQTTIIGTNGFGGFVSDNNLFELRDCDDDNEIKKRFIEGDLSPAITEKLKIYLEGVKTPIAVRSSGLLEDSQSQPFAGVYQTYMLPNNSEDIEERLDQLVTAVKLVYSSVFLNDTRRYIENLNYLIEEESMAVVIQEVVGRTYENYYYPHLSGVAQSYNYYPIGNMANQDGVASIAVGLGQSVVEGEKNFRFCPEYPTVNYLSDEDLIKTTQTDFYALDLSNRKANLLNGEFETLVKLRMFKAEKHRNLYHLASVWDNDNHRIVDGVGLPGPRIINFANILKYNVFPLSEIVKEVLTMAQIALGIPVEIEFAVDLTKDEYQGIKPTFYLLQVRPMTVNFEDSLIDINEIEEESMLLYTEEALGNGTLDDIRDIVFIDPDKFDKTKTQEMCMEIEKINTELKNQGREYILIGPGRWGTRDRFLGIPVIWSQISKAKIIVEVGLEDYEIEPSQGTHFFHNVVAMNIGYFNVPFKKKKKSFIDWNHIKKHHGATEYEYFTHIVNQTPFKVIMDGKNRKSIICK
ncbi:MAG: PEP/pyruvate-binding domain-containing protein [Spirochaetales bacterium]|uniref:PEP/pyruvate-binding domain-containing protein n=1 Tax=Candidatus Thalassospirochaeta sargassi TaxID=3119039 RepID=A0AAJ1IFK7_9SPIO|nr:PEP/pyruvate-binding domain-containing protein [Spirochaetales bacterium]